MAVNFYSPRRCPASGNLMYMVRDRDGVVRDSKTKEPIYECSVCDCFGMTLAEAEQYEKDQAAYYARKCIGCPPCPGRGNDGHGHAHCAECCFGTGVLGEQECPVHGVQAHESRG